MARNNKHRSKPQSALSNHQKKSPNKVAKRVSVGDRQVMVNGYSEQWLRQQFDWVYEKEILGVGNGVKRGDIVEIISQQKHSLGVGIYAGKDSEQNVAVRRFNTRVCDLDVEFFARRIRQAKSRRSIEAQTSAWRLVHSENDDLPGIVVDCWANSISVTLSCVSLKSIVEPLLEAIQSVHRFDNAVGHVRLPHGKQEYLGVLKGQFPERFVVDELGVNYWVHPQLSKDAGLYLDMRPLRAWLVRQGWQNKQLLNLFCYTGAFSLSAAVHGAQTTSVDLSRAYLDRAIENFHLNDLDTEAHRFIESDTFAALDRLRRKQQMFDTVLADPPSFSHSSNGTWSVQKDLKRLVIACLRVLKPGGTLIIATNNGKMPPRDFSKAILDASRKEKRRLRLLLNYVPGTDFPAALHFPEARYLKCWVMEAS